MQAINGIQNAMINANAAAMQNGLVVDAANAHRTYRSGLKRPCVVRPVSKRPDVGFMSSPTSSLGGSHSKPSRLRHKATGQEQGLETRGSRYRRTWRLDRQHLPATAWAMLVLNRSLCG